MENGKVGRGLVYSYDITSSEKAWFIRGDKKYGSETNYRDLLKSVFSTECKTCSVMKNSTVL